MTASTGKLEMHKMLTRGCLFRKARPEKECFEKPRVLFAQELYCTLVSRVDSLYSYMMGLWDLKKHFPQLNCGRYLWLSSSPFVLPLKPWFFYDRQSITCIISNNPVQGRDVPGWEQAGVMEQAQWEGGLILSLKSCHFSSMLLWAN